MDTVSFLKAVLPRQGRIILANIRDRGTFHTAYTTAEEAAVGIDKINASEGQAYFCCGTAAEWNGNTGTRTADNIRWQRSLRVDLDIKPGSPQKYESINEAVLALREFCVTHTLPSPLLIASGGGIHAYWPLTEDVTSDQWLPVAEAFKQALAAAGIKQDRAVTADTARVLRPVGGVWKKAEPHKIVRRIGAYAVHERPLEFYEKVFGAVATLQPLKLDNPLVSKAAEMFGVSNDLKSFPPVEAKVIIQKCATLQYVASLGGDVEEPLWRGMLGVIKHTVEGEGLAHEWSRGYEGYDPEETQNKMDRWETGPTTCKYFREMCSENKCAGCTQGVTSPIMLTEDIPVPLADTVDGDSDGQEPPIKSVSLPQGYNLENGRLSYWQRTDEEGNGKWVPFCDTLFYPIAGHREADDTWTVSMQVHDFNNRVRQFTIPAKCLNELQGLSTELGNYKVWVYGKRGKEMAQDMIRKMYMESLAQTEDFETVTYDHFGWCDNFNTFIIGNKSITIDGEKSVRCTDDLIHSGMGQDFGVEGDTEDWAALVDQIYNRPGAEMYQFAILASAASPLVKVANIDGFHGIPVAYTGEGGVGKTSVCKVASSMWGQGELFNQHANKQGTTLMMALKKVSSYRHLPHIMDEVSNLEAEVLSEMLYALSSGRPRERLGSDGKVRNPGAGWDKFTFITSNKLLADLLSKLEQHVSEATTLRVFEIHQPDESNLALFADTDVRNIINSKLQYIYGGVGRDLLRYYMKNRKKLRNAIHSLRGQFKITSADDTKERFYIDTLVLALVAGAVMQELGFIKFDLKAIRKWGMAHIKSLRAARVEKQYSGEELISKYISSLQGGIIVTKHAGSRGAQEVPLETLRHEPVARIATLDKKVYVSVRSIAEWGKQNGAEATAFRNLLDKHGYVKHAMGRDVSGAFNFRLGGGTSIPTGASRCLELDYSKVFGDDEEAATNKVVSLVKSA